MKKQNRKVTKKSKNKEKNLKLILLLIIIVAIVYALYAIINLVIKPVDKVLIEEGKIYSEETTVGYILRDEEVISRTEL